VRSDLTLQATNPTPQTAAAIVGKHFIRSSLSSYLTGNGSEVAWLHRRAAAPKSGRKAVLSARATFARGCSGFVYLSADVRRTGEFARDPTP
jgi:hypothetical protein